MPFPQMPKAIFFDWDGTLVDSFAFLEAAHNHVLQTYDRAPFSPGAFKEYFGKPREEIYPALYADKADEARGKFEAYVKENNTKTLKPMDGAEELLQTLENLNITMGVVSNKLPEFINAEIDHFGWRKYFASSVGAKEAANDKPSPDPLLLGIERANIEPNMHQIWYVGDTEIDQGCAKAAQSFFIFIQSYDQLTPPTLSANEGLIVKNCTEFADLLLQYTKKAIQS